jgi:hypothetical protein
MTDFDLYVLLMAYRKAIGVPFFTQPWDLNLFVVRDDVVGTWGDLVIAACVDDAGRQVVLRCTATGDAWAGEWPNPTNPAGCVYTLDQHVEAGFILGAHKGRPALIQQRPFRYVRWPRGAGRAPRVSELEELAKRESFLGLCGTHVHNRASDKTPAIPATDDSEGCTVDLYQHEHAALIRLVQQQNDRRGALTVSPTFCKRRELAL